MKNWSLLLLLSLSSVTAFADLDRYDLRSIVDKGATVQLDLLSNSLDRTDFGHLADIGSYVLRVNGTELDRYDLANIADKGVHLLIDSFATRLDRYDLAQLASHRSIELWVNDNEFDRYDLQQ